MGYFSITQTNPNKSKILLYPINDLSGCTEWTPHGDTPNYECINEVKKSIDYSTTYVSMATDDYLVDQYILPDLSDLGTIDYVKIYAVAKTDVPPSSSSEFYIALSPDTDCENLYESSNKGLTNSWAKKSHIWTTNPDTAAAWTWEEVNTLTIGMKAKAVRKESTHHILTLRPNADISIQWDRQPGSLEHFECLDEKIADEDSTYIVKTYGNPHDTYAMENTSISEGVITKVTLFVRGRKVASGCCGGIIFYLNWLQGSSIELSTAYTTYSREYTTNPLTSNPWTWDNINSLVAGIYGSLYTNEIRVTQLYVVVDYYTTNESPTIQVTQCYAEVGYTPSETTCYLNSPVDISIDHTRNINMINFWNGEREVYDESRANKTMVLNGSQYVGAAMPGESFTILGNFDAYDVGGNEWDTNPAYMCDLNNNTYSTSSTTDEVQLLTSNTFDEYLSLPYIAKVEFRVLGRIGYCAHQGAGWPRPYPCRSYAEVDFVPVFPGGDGDTHTLSYVNGTGPVGGFPAKGYSDWVDITNDTNSPAWTLEDLQALDLKVIRGPNETCADGHCDPITYYDPEVYEVELRVTYNAPTPCDAITCVKELAKNGAIITIEDLGALYDGEYRIRSFGWKMRSKSPAVYDWILELESSEL